LFLFPNYLIISPRSPPFVPVLSQVTPADSDAPFAADTSSKWDEFGDSDSKPEHQLGLGSSRPIFEQDTTTGADPVDGEMAGYYEL
ncbi:hypothetical protein LINPERPRIM_LOCUS32457, partial [Linum perenne]